MQQIKKEFTIISAELSTASDAENIARTETLRLNLKLSGYKFKEVLGIYKNSREVSFVVICDRGNELATLLDFARDFNQECILFVDQKRKATLIYDQYNQTVIGTFKACSAKEAVKLDASTYCAELDQWYKVA